MRKRAIATLMATLIFVLGFSALNLTAKAAEIVSYKVNGTPVRFVLDRKTMTATVDGDASQVTLPEKIKINGYLYFKVVGAQTEQVTNDKPEDTTKTDNAAKTENTAKTEQTTQPTQNKAETTEVVKPYVNVNPEKSSIVRVGRKTYPAYTGDRSLLTGFSKKTGGFQEFYSGSGFQGKNDQYMLKSNADGSFFGTVTFQTSLSEAERDMVTYEVVDVTPKAFKEMFEAMGVKSGVKVEKGENVTGTKVKKVNGVNYGFTWFGTKLTVKAEQGTRAVKIIAKRGSEVLDYTYFIANSNYGKNAADMKLYDEVRHRIEDVLWTDDMTNLEKLQSMAAYLNKTMRYPGSEACEKGSKWWNDFSVDGKDLFYNFNCHDISNHMMIYQGGIGTCHTAYMLIDVAKRDLGLPYVYIVNGKEADMVDPSKVGYLTSDEGVFIGAVKCSLNPAALDHTTFWYKEAGAWKTSQFFRKQGDDNPNIKGIEVAGNQLSKNVGEIIKLK